MAAMSAEHETVRTLTSLLRASNEPFWSRLRDLLRERGVPPEHAFVAECFPDDHSFEFVVVVASTGSVFQWGFDSVGKPIEKGEFSEWVDVTARFRLTPY